MRREWGALQRGTERVTARLNDPVGLGFALGSVPLLGISAAIAGDLAQPGAAGRASRWSRNALGAGRWPINDRRHCATTFPIWADSASFRSRSSRSILFKGSSLSRSARRQPDQSIVPELADMILPNPGMRLEPRRRGDENFRSSVNQNRGIGCPSYFPPGTSKTGTGCSVIDTPSTSPSWSSSYRSWGRSGHHAAR